MLKNGVKYKGNNSKIQGFKDSKAERPEDGQEFIYRGAEYV
jgi:hypothetical protein